MTNRDPKTPAEDEQERDLDEALEETFPASDPISPMRHEEHTTPPPRRT